MSDFPSPHHIDNDIKDAAQWNTSARRHAKVLQDMLLFLLYGDTGNIPADDTGMVLGGLEVSAVGGTLRSQITRGAWFFKNATIYVSPLSEFGVGLLEADDTTTLVHSAGDGTHPRNDLIVISTNTGTTTQQAVLQLGGGTLNHDLIREAEITLEVIEGTPAASPSDPAVPTGKLAVARAVVPASETDSANFTYTDLRPRLAFGSRGPAVGTFGDPAFEVLAPVYAHSGGSFLAVSDSQALDAQQASSITSFPGVRWFTSAGVLHLFLNATRHDHAEGGWLQFYRDAGGVPAGDSTGMHYPMMVPGSRDWWLAVGLADGAIRASVGAVDTDWEHYPINLSTGSAKFVGRLATTNAVGVDLFKEVPCPNRGLEVIGAEIVYEVQEAWDATVLNFDAILVHVDEAGTKTTLQTLALSNTVAGVVKTAFTLGSTPVLDEGDRLYLEIDFDVSNTGSSGVGKLRFYALKVQFREGRT